MLVILYMIWHHGGLERSAGASKSREGSTSAAVLERKLLDRMEIFPPSAMVQRSKISHLAELHMRMRDRLCHAQFNCV